MALIEHKFQNTYPPRQINEDEIVWFHGVSVVKDLSAMQEMQETWVQFLGWKDPLEDGMVTHSSVLNWRIPWTKKPGGL